jgi:hypothetical protein
MAPRNVGHSRAKKDAINVRIGLRCREYRTARNLTLDQLAKQTGMSASTLGSLESGDVAPAWMIVELAHYYDCLCDDLMPL